MKFRKLRIAFSVSCDIVCLLLIGLWVWSFYLCTTFRQQVTPTFAFSTIAQRGFVGVVAFNPIDHALQGYYTWGVATTDLSRLPEPCWDMQLHRRADMYAQIMVPLWFVALAIAGLSVAVLRPPWRFSLRTLLIATTLIAVVLGLIVWTTR
jgi:hypothetical protein